MLLASNGVDAHRAFFFFRGRMATAKKKAPAKARGMMAGFNQVTPATSASRPAAASKKVLESIRIEVAANGFTVSCNHSGGSGLEPYRTPKPMVFDSPEAALAYVGSELRKSTGATKTKTAPKKKAAAMPSDDDGDE